MNKRVEFGIEWGSKLLSLVILFQQAGLFLQRKPYELDNWEGFASILIGVIVILLALGFWQKERHFYLTSLFPFVTLIVVLILGVIV